MVVGEWYGGLQPLSLFSKTIKGDQPEHWNSVGTITAAQENVALLLNKII